MDSAPEDESVVSAPRGHVSSTVADWSRERSERFWDPGRRLLGTIRRYQRLKRRSNVVAKLMRRLTTLEHRFWSVITQAEIHLHTEIGGGLLLPHPNGVVIHPQTRIGVNCLLSQQVTLGVSGGKPGVPRIGGHVDIGAGAKVLGPVTIGDHAVIGANAVVIGDVPPWGVAVGAPARVVRIRSPLRDAAFG